MNMLNEPRFLFLALLGGLAPAGLQAAGLDATLVPDNAEWLVHIDTELLSETTTGSLLIAELQRFSGAHMPPEVPLDPVLLINGVRAITAFGTLPDLAGDTADVDAALVLQGTPELMQVLRGLIAGLELENPDAIERMTLDGEAILKMAGQEICGSFLGDDRMVISKSLSSLGQFYKMKRGELPHVVLVERFSTYSMGRHSGIFMGAFVDGVEGLDQLPAQARILQLTEQVSLQLGELDGFLRLMVSLGTADERTARQVSDVLQGLIALTMITSNGEPHVQALIDSARTSLDGKRVHLELGYPAEAAQVWVKMLSELIATEMADEEPGTTAPEREPSAEGEAAVPPVEPSE